ncbi:MAG: PaaI family thioesterase [Acidobacteriota bacterium]|jgi:acyl-coenzyme A thioesterase PaaI-like protein
MNENKQLAFQDCYPDDYAHCFGCGRLNEKGHRIKSFWDGDDSVCSVQPQAWYSGGMKHILYGGLIASLIDCHGAATAAAAKARELKIDLKPGSMPRFVTAALKVDYLAPVPIDSEVKLRARAKSIDGRKVVVEATLSARGAVCARGEGLFIQLKDDVSLK